MQMPTAQRSSQHPPEQPLQTSCTQREELRAQALLWQRQSRRWMTSSRHSDTKLLVTCIWPWMW